MKNSNDFNVEYIARHYRLLKHNHDTWAGTCSICVKAYIGGIGRLVLIELKGFVTSKSMSFFYKAIFAFHINFIKTQRDEKKLVSIFNIDIIYLQFFIDISHTKDSHLIFFANVWSCLEISNVKMLLETYSPHEQIMADIMNII